MSLAPDCKDAKTVTVSTVHAEFGMGMLIRIQYMFMSNCDVWLKQDSSVNLAASPATIGGAGCIFVPNRTILPIDGSCGADISVIEDSTGGKASLAPARSL